VAGSIEPNINVSHTFPIPDPQNQMVYNAICEPNLNLCPKGEKSVTNPYYKNPWTFYGKRKIGSSAISWIISEYDPYTTNYCRNQPRKPELGQLLVI
jgi:hypothetical protein